jgi:hypothetical protein
MSPVTSITTRKITLNSIKDCTKSMGELLAATLEIERLTARRDLRFSEVCIPINKEITAQMVRAAKHETALTEYYVANQKEIEKDGKKFVQLSNGEIGCRLGSKKLVTLAKWTWEKALEKLQAIWPGEYLLPPKPPEIDKVSVKKRLTTDELKACGMEIVQDENFYANPTRPVDPDKVAA